MNRLLLGVAWTTLFVPFLGGATESDDIANELYVNASKSVREMKFETEFGTFSKALRNYQNASEKLENITSNYASTSIAVNLVSGKMKISDLALSEFETLESSLQNMASAEQEPNACALFIANTIDDAGKKIEVLVVIANTYIEIGQKEKVAQILSQSLEIAKQIQAPKDKTSALTEISEGYSKLGKNNEALKFLSQGLELAETITDADDKARVFREIASSFAVNGETSKALEIARTISTAHQKAFALVEILATVNDLQKENVDQILSEVLSIENTIKQVYFKSSILRRISSIYSENGYKEKSDKVLSDALILTKKIKIPYLKSASLNSIASVFTKNDQNEKAVQILSRALEIAIEEKDDYLRASILTSISSSYIKLGQKEKAIQILSKALDTAKSIDGIMNNIVLPGVAEAYAEASQFTLAFDVAQTISIDEFESRDIALLGISRELAKAGLLSKALETVKKIKDAKNKAIALADIANKYNKMDQQLSKTDTNLLHKIVYTIYASPSNIKSKQSDGRSKGLLSDWIVSESTSPVDDSPSVTMIKAAESGDQTLVVRCFENKTTAYINTGTYLGYEHSTRVTTRLDKEKARTRNWTISTDSKGVFVPGGYIKWIKSLMGHKKLMVRVLPRNSSPSTFEFTVSGLENAIRPLRKACHW